MGRGFELLRALVRVRAGLSCGLLFLVRLVALGGFARARPRRQNDGASQETDSQRATDEMTLEHALLPPDCFQKRSSLSRRIRGGGNLETRAFSMDGSSLLYAKSTRCP